MFFRLPFVNIQQFISCQIRFCKFREIDSFSLILLYIYPFIFQLGFHIFIHSNFFNVSCISICMKSFQVIQIKIFPWDLLLCFDSWNFTKNAGYQNLEVKEVHGVKEGVKQGWSKRKNRQITYVRILQTFYSNCSKG